MVVNQSPLAVNYLLLYTEIDMEHHPIPQQISSYEFRLVGSMTLKQFIKLAGGLIIAFLFYNSKLIFFIKWPMVILFASLGAGLAFMPINEQPLEKWILAFFNSIYSPSIYIWQKQPQLLGFEEGFYQPQEGSPMPEEPAESEDKEPRLEEFLATIDEDRKVKSPPGVEAGDKETTPVEEEVKEPETEPKPRIELERQKPLEATAEAEYGEIPMPKTPQTPNKVVGMVFTREGKMVENAIIEIQDKNGNAVRALRTNRLGQFETATPLSKGEYLVTVEKEGYDFDILKIEAKGEVLEPLIIKTKNGKGNG